MMPSSPIESMLSHAYLLENVPCAAHQGPATAIPAARVAMCLLVAPNFVSSASTHWQEMGLHLATGTGSENKQRKHKGVGLQATRHQTADQSIADPSLMTSRDTTYFTLFSFD